jgi:hypothetical protein
MATATLESAAAPAGGNLSADDLLSKMAGAEIDRLLNEADAEHQPPKPAAPQPVATAVAEDTALAAQLDDLIDGTQTEKAAAPTSAPAAAATAAALADAAEQERLKVLAAELEVDKPAAAAPAPAAAPAATPPADAPAAEPKPQPIPLLIRPLIWINAPFAFLPEPARSLLGKAAVLTLINASALLVYVALFRHAH